MTIHSEHPFQPPDEERNPARRLRGRLPAAVTLWTSAGAAGRTGLTVSSLLVADGDPAYVVGMLDPLSELWDALRESGKAAVTVLGWADRQLADAFGYVAPAPGGPFRLAEWRDTPWGPVLAGASAWAGGRLVGQPEELGWGLLVTLQIDEADLGEDTEPLIHRRGRYFTF